MAFEMVRTDQPGHWNPKKAHTLTYAITKLDDHASGGCCADWFTTGFGFSNQPHLDFDDDHTPDGDIVNPGWKATTTLSAGQVTAAGPVWEWDSGPNDHYDVIPEAGLFDTDAFFRITASVRDSSSESPVRRREGRARHLRAEPGRVRRRHDRHRRARPRPPSTSSPSEEIN